MSLKILIIFIDPKIFKETARDIPESNTKEQNRKEKKNKNKRIKMSN